MKILVLLFFIFGVSFAIYLFVTYFIFNFNKLKKINWIAFGVSAFVGLTLAIIIGVIAYRGINAPDSWCTTTHVTNSYPPMELIDAMDYFEKGNYEYDLGNCKGALESYSEAIRLNPDYPQSYNNKAFTYMHMGEYDEALYELNMALSVNPNYINALMNRGDIYRDKLRNREAAIADYEKIISLSGTRGTSICGHLVMAKYYNAKNPLSFFTVLTNTLKCRNGK